MTSFTRSWSALACAVLVLSGLVLAERASASDPSRVTAITGSSTVEDGLTSAEDRLYARTFRQTGTLTSTAATFHCKTARATARAKNAFGQTVFWYRQRLGWCYNGGTVVKGYGLTPRCRGTTYKITAWGFSWSFEGHMDCRSLSS